MIVRRKMKIENAGNTNDPLSVLAGNKATGLVDLRDRAQGIPGEGNLWDITHAKDDCYNIENAGNTNDPLSILAGNKATGFVDLRDRAQGIPGEGNLWRIIDTGDGRYKIENAGNTNDPLLVLAGNKATGLVDLRDKTQGIPGEGNLWRIIAPPIKQIDIQNVFATAKTDFDSLLQDTPPPNWNRTIITPGDNETVETYLNLNGYVFCAIINRSGTHQATFWWVERPLGGIEQIGTFKYKAEIEILGAGFIPPRIGGTLRVGQVDSDTVILRAPVKATAGTIVKIDIP